MPCAKRVANSQERMTWLYRNGSDEDRARSTASRTNCVSTTSMSAYFTVVTLPIELPRSRRFVKVFHLPTMSIRILPPLSR